MEKIAFKIIAIAAAAVVTGALAFAAGRTAGINHALNDSCIWTVERYDPEKPEESGGEIDGTNYDQIIYIELDGDLYAHGMFQG